MEDTLVKEYDMEIDGVCIHIKQYQVSDSTETVSYTHLDVYKRQGHCLHRT